MNRHKTSGSSKRLFLGVGMTTLAVSLAFGANSGNGGQRGGVVLAGCCAELPAGTCPGQNVTLTACIGPCATNEVCTGASGCTPIPWVKAKCVRLQ